MEYSTLVHSARSQLAADEGDCHVSRVRGFHKMPNMTTRQLGKDGPKVSALGLGCMSWA